MFSVAYLDLFQHRNLLFTVFFTSVLVLSICSCFPVNKLCFTIPTNDIANVRQNSP